MHSWLLSLGGEGGVIVALNHNPGQVSREEAPGGNSKNLLSGLKGSWSHGWARPLPVITADSGPLGHLPPPGLHCPEEGWGLTWGNPRGPPPSSPDW